MDRRNTSLQASGYYDSTTNAWTSGTVPSGYHSTNTSPQIIIDSGNSSSVLTGVMYQPRGASATLLTRIAEDAGFVYGAPAGPTAAETDTNAGEGSR